MSHFYTTEGKPFYQIPTLDGKKLRDCTIKDARKLKLVPGVTDILKVNNKEGLNEWIINQVLESILKSKYALPKQDFQYLLDHANDETEEKIAALKTVNSWKGMIRQEAAKLGKEAAEKGNVIHDNLENAFIGLDVGASVNLDSITRPVIDFITEKFGTGFVAEGSFAHPLGFGGKIDLHHPKKAIIIDFKTKPDKAFDKQLGYDDHTMQLAAYGAGLGFVNDDNFLMGEYYNLFISHETPGKFELVEWDLEQIARGWEMFKSLHRYWTLLKKYNPSFKVK